MTISWGDPSYLVTENGGHPLVDLSPGILLLFYATFSLAIIYSAFWDHVNWYKSLFARSAPHRSVGIPIDEVTTSQCNFRAPVDETRGDKQPIHTYNSIATKQSYSVKSFDDGTDFNENTFGSSGYYTASSNYSDQSYKSKIVGGGSGGGNVKVTLTRSTFQGTECEADRRYDVHQQTVKKSQEASMQDDYHNPSFRETPHTDLTASSWKVKCPRENPFAKNTQNEVYTVAKKDQLSSDVVKRQVQNESETQNSSNDHFKQQKIHQPTKPSSPYSLPEPKKGYSKSTYAVLIGGTVKVYSTNIFAALPSNNKFLVKERHQDLSGVTRVKLTLKSTEKRYIIYQPLICLIINHLSFAKSCWTCWSSGITKPCMHNANA